MAYINQGAESTDNLRLNQDYEVLGTFESFESKFSLAMNEIDNAISGEDVLNLVNEYSNLLHIEDSTIVPNIRNSAYRKICNEDGIYIVGNTIYKIIDEDYLVSTELKLSNLLANINSLSEANQNNKMEVFQFRNFGSNSVINGRTEAACGSSQYVTYTNNNAGCKNDRRVCWTLDAFFVSGGGNYYPYVENYLIGQRKLGGVCIWTGYSTNLHTDNCSWTLKAIINGTTYTYPKTFSDYDSPSGENRYDVWNADVAGPIFHYTGTPSIYFDAAYEEGSSTGTGGGQAIINCN